MSNKILIITIVIILLAFGGFVWAMRLGNNTTVTGTGNNPADQQGSGQNQQSAENQAPQATSSPALASSSPAKDAPPLAAATACKRDFNQNTLTNAKVSIQNRMVQISVKDFGSISLEFYDKDAPKAVENFLRLANAGYYDCLTFHRIAKGFVIQGGDPNGDGSGGQSAFGKAFADELNPDTPSYKAGYLKGVLAMANSGPNTNGSQFFIMLADNQLPHNYTIFGKVSSGQDVVDKIGQADITPVLGDQDGKPVTPVVMQSVKIIK